MTGLVLEGGTFRAIFSSGVMDAFIEKGIKFPYVIGVSAGISDAASYVSGQSGRNLDIMENFRHDKRYMGGRNFLECGCYFGMDFVFDDVPNKYLPFDYDTFRSSGSRFMVGVTNAETGRSEYFDGINDSEKWQYLRATCAIPLLFRPQRINGREYFDGGLADPICAKQALRDGCRRLVIVLTQPEGFVKKCRASNIIAAAAVGRKYPNIEKALLIRHRVYNRTVHFCEELERRGRAVIIRPDMKLESLEKDIGQIRKNYRHGYEKGLALADKVSEFMMN